MKARAFIAYSRGLARAGPVLLPRRTSRVPAFRKQAEDGYEVNTPVARNGEHAQLDGGQEAQAVAPYLLEDVPAHVLEVDVAHPPDVPLQDARRILSGKR